MESSIAKERPWISILRQLYLDIDATARERKPVLKDGPGSLNKQCLQLGFNLLAGGVGWKIKSGSTAKVWLDDWFANQPLRSLIQGPLNRGRLDAC